MKAPSFPGACSLRFAAVCLLASLTWPASAETSTIILYRKGTKDTVLRSLSGKVGSITVKAARGSASAEATAMVEIPGITTITTKTPDNYDGPLFRALAKGGNPKDSSAGSGEVEKLVTLTSVRFGEVLTISEAAGYNLDISVHGTISPKDNDGAGFARATVEIIDLGSWETLTSHIGDSDNPGLFDGETHRIPVTNVPFTPFGLISYQVSVEAAANISIQRHNVAEADLLGTVHLAGLTVVNADGKRIEAPDLMSKSGFDYSPILNLPIVGATPGPGEFAFATEAPLVQEDGASMVVRVNRNNGSATVVVRNVTVPPPGEVFQPFETTLDFADGETQKHVLVKLINGSDVRDLVGPSVSTFDLELANPTGATLAATGATATVSVCDDDVVWSAPDAEAQTLVARINASGGVGETGLMTFSVTAKGAVTFTGTLRGKRFYGSGTEGALNFAGGGKILTVAGIGKVKFTLLRYKTIKGTPRLLGTATLPDGTELGIRGVAVFTTDKTKPKTSKRGAYTLLLEPSAGAPAAAPKGTGYATVTVTDSGKTTITGKLADGTALTAGGTLNVLADLPLLVTLPAKRGELSGLLKFRYIPETSHLDAELSWTRPASTVKGPFMAGFATTLAATGSRFIVPPTGAYILPGLTSEADDAVFKAEGPDLTAPVIRQVTIGPAAAHKVTPISTAERLTLRMVGRTGLWSGSFRHGLKTITYQGALHQLTNRGAGYFLGATQSGSVSLGPGTVAP